MDLDYTNKYTNFYSTSSKTPLLRVTGDAYSLRVKRLMFQCVLSTGGETTTLL